MPDGALNYRTVPAYARDPHDFYVEPAWCTELLLEAERFVGEIHDPACGAGTILAVAEARGHCVSGADLVDRAGGRWPVRDFRCALPMPQVGNVICNPPFKLAEDFIRRALEISRFKVAMLVQEKFLFSERRRALFAETPLARVLFLSSRPSMPPGAALAAGALEARGGRTNYAWLVWSHDHKGPPTAGWLIRRKGAA